MLLCNSSNRCAVFGLILPFAILWGTAVPAGATGYLTDAATGVSEQSFAAAICELEDMNADGRAEFLVGAPGDNQNGLQAGAVFYYRSRPNNAHGQQQIWRGVGGEKFGFAVARIGDVNSDGIPDFAVGAPLSDTGGADSGRVCLFWGGSTISSTPNLVIAGATGGDQFGFSISAAGDFNGDGEDDFIVGAPYRNQPGLDSGAAYVIFGDNGGPSTDLADALVLGGEIAGNHFGWSVSDAGNFLGTANDCVAVGAPDNLAAGAVYVYEGASFPSSPNAVFDKKIVNGAAAAPGSKYGFSVENAGRWDNDGYDDLAIGAPFCNESAIDAGRVEIVFGDTSPSSSGDRYVNGETATDNLGYALAGVGDVIGTGSDDLLIGSPGYDGDASNGGRAYLFAGGSSSNNDAGNLEVIAVDPLNPGTSANDRFGWAVSAAGLFDDDDSLDYAIGAPGGNIETTAAAGYCWVQDSGGGLVGLTLPQWDVVRTDQGTVEVSFILALDQSGLQSLALSRLVPGAPPQLLWEGSPLMNEGVTEGPAISFEGPVFSFTDATAPAGEFSYRLAVTTTSGQTFTLDSLAGPSAQLVSRMRVEPAWPNPFNPSVSVRFQAPVGTRVQCRVTDLRGHLVTELYEGQGSGEWRTLTWNGRHDSGARVASGIYLISVEAGNERQVQRVVLAK